MMTTAFSKVLGCQQPAEGVPEFLKGVEGMMGTDVQEDFSSRTRRVRRKPLVKK
jgi:hypothetical protein